MMRFALAVLAALAWNFFAVLICNALITDIFSRGWFQGYLSAIGGGFVFLIIERERPA